MSFVQNLVEYLRSSREEFSKVHWPTRQDTIRYSALVIGISVVIAAFFATLDFGLSHGVQAILAQKIGANSAAQPTPTVTSSSTDSSIQVTPATSAQGNNIQLTPTVQTTPGSGNVQINAVPVPSPSKPLAPVKP